MPLLLSLWALAQTPDAAPAAAPAAGALPEAGAPSADVAATDERLDVMMALDLPIFARDLRDAGLAEADVAAGLGAMREAGLGAGDASRLAESTRSAVKDHGPIDGFGAFVKARLADGLRGTELAEAIRAEHQARGTGGKGKGPPPGPPPGRPGGPGGPALQGAHGKPEGVGRPEGAGKKKDDARGHGGH